MSEALNTIKYNIELYYGDFVFLGIAVIAFIYLAVTCKELRGKILFPIGLILFCIVNPILYKFVFSKIIYWRLFWTIPDAMIIALAGTKFIQARKNNLFKVGILATAVALIVVCGKNAFKENEYSKAENWYKLNNEVIEVCDIILSIDDTPKCIFPIEFYSYVRQYSSNINLLYGRNVMDKYIVNSSVSAKKIYQELGSEMPDYDYVMAMSSARGCNFIVCGNLIDDNTCAKYGYERINTYKQHHIYYNPSLDANNEGWLITMKATSTAQSWNMNFITIEDGNGELIIIDGGNGYNLNDVTRKIKSYENQVAAWIITNPDKFYATTLHDILENNEEIQIGKIYTIIEDKYDYQSFGIEVDYVDIGDDFSVSGLTFSVDYKGVNEEKGYAMMCLDVISTESSFKLYTSLNNLERKKLEKMGIEIPDYSSKVDRYVIR
ncbi:MAG: hypothetical protein E7259_04365 [Lachnospiraceae bacterium]|nr:hypothetical protein [Lachnospiraceae bacterium]